MTDSPLPRAVRLARPLARLDACEAHRVLAHRAAVEAPACELLAHGPPVPGDGHNAAPDEMAVRYYLSNEGTGPAFNVEHWVEVNGRRHTGQSNLYPTMRAGETIPQLPPASAQPVPTSHLTIGVKLTEWNDKRLVYRTRFENLLGERFEVSNYPDPKRPATFSRAL